MKKGIILAGGFGSRLDPITRSVSKQLIPVYDKPLIYYPLTTMIEAGIKNILIITRSDNQKSFIDLLGNGERFGIKITYAKQAKPSGIAEAFKIGNKFIGTDSVMLILGDNIFYGIDFSLIKKITRNNNFGSIIFSYFVENPERYGVVKYENKKIIQIAEKPKKYISNLAVTGIYYFDNKVINYVKNIKPSKRKELEIIDIIKIYKNKNKLKLINLEKGSIWLDAGDSKSLLQASQLVQTIQDRQRLLIGSPEIAAMKMKNISLKELSKIIKNYPHSTYKSNLIDYIK